MSSKNSDSTAKQLDVFKAAARALECDEDKGRFETLLGKIAAAKPPKDEPQPKRKKANAK